MIEAKFFKDYKHNYMILKCDGEGEGDSYRRNMLASNKIDRLLKCSVRNINGEAYFYYDISSKVTFENFYRNKKMTYGQLKDFFEQIDMIYRNLGDYFMEEGGLLIWPEHIYYDITSGKYFGLYYPCRIEQTGAPYEPLTDFLLNHVDTGDQKLVDIIYRIYEMSEEPYFLTSDVLPLFEEVYEDAYVTNQTVQGCLPETCGSVRAQQPWPENNAFTGEETAWEEEELKETILSVETEKKKGEKVKDTDACPEQKGSRRFYGIFAVLSLFGMGAAGGVYYACELTQKEFMLVMGCLALTGLCFVFSAIQVVLSGNKTKKKEQKDKELVWNIEDEFREERPVMLHEVLDKNMDLSVAGGNVLRRAGMAERGRTDRNTGKMPAASELCYGDTVFIDTGRQHIQYKLYALDKKNKKHIELTRFPYTIGKMAGCVDCVLTDDSISRLHARIERIDEKILLTDMNSTNGTFKNGLRMEPSETVEIEIGDEIRFGKLNYCYR